MVLGHGADDRSGSRYFTQISPGGSYVADLLPGLLLIGHRHAVRVRGDLDRRADRRARPATPASRRASTTRRTRSAARSASLRSRRSRSSRTEDLVGAGHRSRTPLPRASRLRCGPASSSPSSGWWPRSPWSRTSAGPCPKVLPSSEDRETCRGRNGERPGRPLPIRASQVRSGAVRPPSPSTSPAPSRGPSPAARRSARRTRAARRRRGRPRRSASCPPARATRPRP